MSAFHGWHHCMANTFGTWLPGDPRGYRTRHHRAHIEGDYQQPPPAGTYDALHQHAQELLPRAAVRLTPMQQRQALAAVIHALAVVHRIDVLAVSISATHMHVLARFGSWRPTIKESSSEAHVFKTWASSSPRAKPTSAIRDPARRLMGIAKKQSAKALAIPGGTWARRGKIVPIRDRAHQIRVYHYILAHAREGAVVWGYKDGIPTIAAQ